MLYIYIPGSDFDKEPLTFVMECNGVLGNLIHITDKTPGTLGHGISEVVIFGEKRKLTLDLFLYVAKLLQFIEKTCCSCYSVIYHRMYNLYLI